MPDRQTTEYRATQQVYSIKFKLIYAILRCNECVDYSGHDHPEVGFIIGVVITVFERELE